MAKEVQNNASGGFFYFMGFLGAAIFFIGKAASFGAGVVGFLKAIIWPLFLVLDVFKYMAG